MEENGNQYIKMSETIDKSENRMINIDTKDNQFLNIGGNKSFIYYSAKENRKSSLSRLAKDLLLHCISDTTIVGPPNLTKKNLHIGMKAVWLVCFLGCFSYCIVSVVQTFQDYLKYPTLITTTYVHEIPTKFPAVSFCNMKNPDRSSVYTQRLLVDLTSKNVSLDFPLKANTSLSYWVYAENYFWLTFMATLVNTTFRKSIGYQIEDMLVSCMFNYLPCSSSDFSYFYHPRYGNCYTFNKQIPSKTISVPGVVYGLTLELYLGNPSVDTINNAKDGIIMSIHNQTDAPFTKMDVINVPTRAETDLIINRNFISRMPFPYGSCMQTEFSSDLYKYIVNTLNISYSQEYCFSLCLQNQTKINCGCINVFLPMFESDNSSFCSNEQIECMSNFVNTFGKTPSNTICQSACEFECESIEFDIKSYNGHYPTKFYTSILQLWVQNNN